MYKNLKRKLRGFTLIELLVTMGIIALLTSIVMFSMSEVRAQSRDKSRMVDLKQLELALELYREANGEYPAGGCGANGFQYPTPGPATGNYISCDVYIDGLEPVYIPNLPTDPKSELVSNRGFVYRSNGTSYKVFTHGSVEALEITSQDDEFARCPSSCTSEAWCQITHWAVPLTYAIYSPGAECW